MVERQFLKAVKALIVQTPYEIDLGNVVQIARAEAMKIFHKPNKIKVVDVLKWYPHGWIVVVQNSEGCIAEKLKTE
jgi:hypothetical protein